MVRTRDSASRVAGFKAPRKALGGASRPAADGGGSANASLSSSSKTNKQRDGGNPVCPRETPAWQKPITDFFKKTQGEEKVINDDESNACVNDSQETGEGTHVGGNISPEENPKPQEKCETSSENLDASH